MSWLPSPIPHPLSYFDAPGWMKECLDWVIGMDWPEGDEQATWDLADDWYAVAGDLADPLTESERAALDAVAAFGGTEGKVAAAIKEAWGQIGSGDEKSALQAAAHVAGALGEMLEGGGCDIQGAKLEYYIELGLLLIELIALAVAAFFTFGASTAAAGPVCMATRFAIKEILKRLLKSLIERGIKRAVKDKLKDLGKDFGKKLGKWAIKAGKEGLDEMKEEVLTQGAIQTYQTATGRRDGLDLGDLAMAGWAGFAGGAASTLAGGHNGGFASKVAHGARGEVLGDIGGSLATGQMPDAGNLGMAATSGARSSVNSHLTSELNNMTNNIVSNLAGTGLDGDPSTNITAAAAGTAAAGGGGSGGGGPHGGTAGSGGSGGGSGGSGDGSGGSGGYSGSSGGLAGIAPPEAAPAPAAPAAPAPVANVSAQANTVIAPAVAAAPQGMATPATAAPAAMGPASGLAGTSAAPSAPSVAPSVSASASASVSTGSGGLSGSASGSGSATTGGGSANTGSATGGTGSGGPSGATSTSGSGSTSTSSTPSGSTTSTSTNANPATGARPVGGIAGTVSSTQAGLAAQSSTPPQTGPSVQANASTTIPSAQTSASLTTPSTQPNASTTAPSPQATASTNTTVQTPSPQTGPTAHANTSAQTGPTAQTNTTAQTGPASQATATGPQGTTTPSTSTQNPATQNSATTQNPASQNPAAQQGQATSPQSPSTNQQAGPQATAPAQQTPGDPARPQPPAAQQTDPATPAVAIVPGADTRPAGPEVSPPAADGRRDGERSRSEARRWSDAYHGGLRAQRREILASMGRPGALAAAAWDALNRHDGADFTRGGVTTDDVSALTGSDQPPSVDATRRYDQRGGYRPVLTQHQLDLENAVPRGEDGRPLQFPPLRSGWLRFANDGGPQADPTRAVNCVDVLLSVADTWLHGRPRCAAARTLDGFASGNPDQPSGPEPRGPHRIEDFFGGRLQQLCPDTRGLDRQAARQTVDASYARLADQLRQAGPGAMAVVIHHSSDGTAHTWPVFNDGGVIMYADPQQPPGTPTTTPPYTDGIIQMDAMVIGPDGEQSLIDGAPTGAWSQYQGQPDPAAAPAGVHATQLDADMQRPLTDQELADLGVGEATMADLGYPDPSVLDDAERARLESLLPQTALVNPQDLRFTQRSVSPNSGNVTMDEFAAQMAETGWRGGPAHVIAWGDGSMSSMDNRRMRAARVAGLTSVPVCVHRPDEPLSSMPEAEDPDRDKYRRPLAVDIRMVDGRLVVGGDRGTVAHRAGTVPTTFGEAALFRAAEQRSLLPGRLYGSDVTPATIGKPPGPDRPLVALNPHQQQVLNVLRTAAASRAETALPVLRRIAIDLNAAQNVTTDRVLDSEIQGDPNDPDFTPEPEPPVRLRGTGQMVKSQSSLERKFWTEGRRHGVDRFAGEVNDAARFSLQLPGGPEYMGSLRQTIAALEDAGYELTDLKNFFRPGNRYQGLNATFKAPDGGLMEIQFPTAESFRAWQLTHDAYAVFRQKNELEPRRVHALLSMLAVNRELGLNESVPPGVDEFVQERFPEPDPSDEEAETVPPVIDTSLTTWISNKPEIWQAYRAWLDQQGVSHDGFASILAEFGLDSQDTPVNPELAARLEDIDDSLLPELRQAQGGRPAPGDLRDGDVPGRDAVGLRPEGLGLRPVVDRRVHGQAGERGEVRPDQSGRSGSPDAGDHEGDRGAPRRGDDPLDLPVEGGPAPGRRLTDPADPEAPSDPAGPGEPPSPPEPGGRFFEPRPDAELSAYEVAMLDDVHERALAASETALTDLRRVTASVEQALGLPEGSLPLRDPEHRAKSRESLQRKYLAEGRIGGPEQFAATVNDSVRFSVQLPDGAAYRPALDAVIAQLAAAGYELEGTPKNFWRAGNRFYGTNTTFRAPDGTLVEVQFPTQLSYELWHATHVEYEVMRDVDAEPEQRIRALLRMLEVNRAAGMLDAIPPGMVGDDAKDASLAKWISDNPEVWRAFTRQLEAQGLTPGDVIAEYDLTPDDFPITPKVAARLEELDVVLQGHLPQGHRGLPEPGGSRPDHLGGGLPGAHDLGPSGPELAVRPGDGGVHPGSGGLRLPTQADRSAGGRADSAADHEGGRPAAERGGDPRGVPGVAPSPRRGDAGLDTAADPAGPDLTSEADPAADPETPPMPGSTPPGPVGMDPSDPNHPQWPYRAGLQTRRMSLELQRRQQEADALAAEAAKHLAEMHKYRSWAQFYSEQQPDAEQAKLCQEWADRHQQWAAEWGKASKAAYNGTYTANQTTTVDDDTAWVAVNTDDGDLLVDVPAADGRPYLHRGGLRPPLQQHQDDLVAALPRTPGGQLQMTPDPRVGSWFGLANDGGPELDPSRGINCVDCMISAWRTWRGRPQVSAPRTFDGYAGTDVNAVTGGEAGGMARVAAAVGGTWQTVFPNMSQSPAAQAQQWSDWGFASVTHELTEAGHGAAMFIVTEWQAGTSHAWLAVNQNGTILFLDPQTRQISENVSMYGHTGDPSNNGNVVGMYAMMLDSQGDPQPMSSLAQTSWGKAELAQQQPAPEPDPQPAPDPQPMPEQDQQSGPAAAGPAPLPDPGGPPSRPTLPNPPPGSEGHHIGGDQNEGEAVALYADIRRLTDDVQRIAANQGIPEDVIARARRNLFLQVHQDVATGTDQLETGLFTAILNVGLDWQAAYEGPLTGADRERFRRTLAHEYIESVLMERHGMAYRPAHFDYWENNEWEYPTATPEHFAAHDVAPSQGRVWPFGHYHDMGLEEPDIEIAPDLSNLEDVVDEIMRRLRQE
ncbi:toxin glutamine deamidase domain-containing protein [Catellatospora sichuanensis]|uniref:toxin glutamine deamidase domain-containing protein n=1 Tax=Catellatospora sichuanensis TaxID=1969805 RepID=UPI0011823B99|nr:toxin glutamine deamidase domain-containing protein [Catellatospora sichuanensis]